MTNEELILERLDRIESQLIPMVQSVKNMNELKNDLVPLLNQGVQQLINELEDVEAGFQLEDLLALMKRFLRSTRNIRYALDQLENIIDFITTVEPLLRSAVPKMINYLDDLEQRGVLRIIRSTVDISAKVADQYTPEDVDQIGDGFVAALGLAEKLSDRQTIDFVERMAQVPGKVDLTSSRSIGAFGLLGAMADRDVRKGLGVMVELTKAMGKLKDNDAGTDAFSV